MTDRIPLDELNSDQYDALYDERDRLRAAWRSARQRARVLSDELTRRAPLLGEYATEIQRLRANRAAVLREAAAAVRRQALHDGEDFCHGIEFAADFLRRMAVEAQQPECPQCDKAGACNGGPCPLVGSSIRTDEA